MTPDPPDPITALQEGAAQLHEALYLCGQILQAGMRRGQEGT